MTTTIETLKNALPAYAKDIKLNLSSVLSEEQENLSGKQQAIIAVAVVNSLKQPTVTEAVESWASATLSAEEVDGARLAAALMGMNNIYYRFAHLSSNQDYLKMPARLRMNSMSNPGIESADFELASLAVSVVNGCGLCIDSHEKKLQGENVTTACIQDAARIAAVLHAVAQVLMSQSNSSAGSIAA